MTMPPLPPLVPVARRAEPPLPRLAEALGDLPGAEPPTPEQAARAARDALAQVLRQRSALAQDLDGELERLLRDSLARVTAQLAAAPTDYQQWVLPRLMEGIGRVLDELAVGASARASDALRRATELGDALVQAPLAAESGAAALTPTTAPGATAAVQLGVPQLAQLRALQHVSTGLIKGAATDAVNQINRALGQVVLGASTPFDAIRAVARLLPDRTRAQLRGIVNTNLATAFNSAAWERMKAQAERDPALRKQWRRSGKTHSRANHDAADGQVQDVTAPFTLLDGHKPGKTVQLMYPADPAAPVGEVIHCGCVALPWKASWKMRTPDARALTDAEKAARATAQGKPRARATPKERKAMTTQQRILDAFAALPTWRDVTGQALLVDARLAPDGIGDTRLTKPALDLYSYHAVQTIKRPGEVWQTERVDVASGEIIRERIFLKSFSAAGATWLGQATFRLQGGTWVPVGPYAATRVGAEAGLAAVLAGVRAGARVWPKRR